MDVRAQQWPPTQLVPNEPPGAAEPKPEPTPPPAPPPVEAKRQNRRKGSSKKGRRGRKPNRFKEQRWKIIQKVYAEDPGLKGRMFWEKAEAQGAKPDPIWRANLCPKRLSDAYDDDDWQRTLIDDKTRATQKQRSQ
jgi:hypothetical protein